MDQLDLFKIKNICSEKAHVKRMKDNVQTGSKYLQTKHLTKD